MIENKSVIDGGMTDAWKKSLKFKTESTDRLIIKQAACSPVSDQIGIECDSENYIKLNSRFRHDRLFSVDFLKTVFKRIADTLFLTSNI